MSCSYKLQKDISFIHEWSTSLEVKRKNMSVVTFARRRVQTNFNYALSGDSIRRVLDGRHFEVYVDSRIFAVMYPVLRAMP